MIKTRVYLDNCCFNRPFDKHKIFYIELEIRAKLEIQKKIKNGIIELVWSFILNKENNDNPYLDRKESIKKWKNISKILISKSNEEILNSTKKIMSLGIRVKDALHVACAISAKCNYFITTDKKLLNKDIKDIKIINPIDFIEIERKENYE